MEGITREQLMTGNPRTYVQVVGYNPANGIPLMNGALAADTCRYARSTYMTSLMLMGGNSFVNSACKSTLHTVVIKHIVMNNY